MLNKYVVKMEVEYEMWAEDAEECEDRAISAVIGEESVTWDFKSITVVE